jgi:hypothetical protein
MRLGGLLNEEPPAATNFDFKRQLATEVRGGMKGPGQFFQGAKMAGQVEG